MKRTFFAVTLSVIVGSFGLGFCGDVVYTRHFFMVDSFQDKTGFCGDVGVHEHGYWYGEGVISEHQFDHSLAIALAHFFKHEKAKSVVDFGCGTGAYTKTLLNRNIYCEGYDGNPDSFNISGGIVTQLVDLSSFF